MKYLKFACISIILIFVFSACEKEYLGSYSPAKKIDKIFSKTGNTPVLYESWYWSGNTPSKIERYNNNGNNIQYTQEFNYGNGKIYRVKVNNDVTEYLYKNNKYLKEVNYYRNNNLLERYEITFVNDKPSVIYFYFGNKKNSDESEILSPLKNFCKDTETEEFIISKCSKDTKDGPTGKIEVKWIDNNVSRVDFCTYKSNGYEDIVTYTYTYDKFKNPFSGFLSSDFESVFNDLAFMGDISENNVTCKYKTVFNENLNQYVTESWTYEYEYEKKFPTSVVITHHPASGTSSVTGTYSFKY